MDAIITIIILTALCIALITDIKTREVPNWITYSLIFIGLGLRTLYSVIYSNFMLLLYGLAGFAAFFLLAYLLFYTGQWGGGDSKLLMGLGALIGLEFSKNAFLLSFFINILLVGAVYAILYSIVLAFSHPRKLAKKLKKILKKKYVIFAKRSMLLLVLILVAASFFFEPTLRLGFVLLALITFIMFYIWLFVKAVETSCMFKLLPVSKLTEGDWIVKDIIVKGKRITGPKDLGISNKQIKQLIKLKVKKVLVKQGAPFVPSFLVAFILTLIYGNLFLLLL